MAHVVEGEEAILVGGRAPVDDEHVVTGGDQVLDQAAPGREVEHVVAVDQRRHEQDRRAPPLLARARRAIAQEPPLVLAPHLVGWRQPDRGRTAARALGEREERRQDPGAARGGGHA
jgi:hypothetical protein